MQKVREGGSWDQSVLGPGGGQIGQEKLGCLKGQRPRGGPAELS